MVAAWACIGSGVACSSWTWVPRAQVPALISARGDEIEVTDTDAGYQFHCCP